MDTIQTNFQKDIDAISQIHIVPGLLDVICKSTNMGFAAIARVTEERWITCAVRDDIQFGLKPGDELEIKTTICDEIRHDKKAVVIDHVEKDPLFQTIIRLHNMVSKVIFRYPFCDRTVVFSGRFVRLIRNPIF